MKYSFNTWAFSSYPNWLPAYPIEEVIRRLSVLGYDAVELGCTALWTSRIARRFSPL